MPHADPWGEWRAVALSYAQEEARLAGAGVDLGENGSVIPRPKGKAESKIKE
jgi:hypothetical protein